MNAASSSPGSSPGPLATPPPATPAEGAHRVGEANSAAAAQITAVIGALRRARWRQTFLDCASTALFFAVLAGIVTVFAIRQFDLAASPWLAVLTLVVLALVGATLFALNRRPDDLAVAIAADLKLNLKQRLSTAWEFMQQGPTGDRTAQAPGVDHDIVERLATQAVKARLPAPSRAAHIFASRFNAYALMLPVAVIALVLVGIVEFDADRTQAAASSDEMVISEGVRLRDYGQRMRGRAQQRDLPRSTEQAARVRELGSQMQSGSLSRDDALSRLRDLDSELNRQREQALAEGEQTRVGPLTTQELDGAPGMRGATPQQLLQQLLDGNLSADDFRGRMLNPDPSNNASQSLSQDELRDALNRFEAGDRQALEDILEQMSRESRATRDAQELADAREQIARSRESLGDSAARPAPQDRARAQAGANADGGEASNDERAAQSQLDDDLGDNGSAMPGGLSTRAQREREQTASQRELPANDQGPQLKARGQLGDGGVFVSEARVLPRAGNAALDNQAIDARYTQQLEEVMANEQYPAHYKAFIRQYFLNLSNGVRGEAASPEPLR